MPDRLCPECHRPVHGRQIHLECKRIRNARKNATRTARMHNSGLHQDIRRILLSETHRCSLCPATVDLTVDYVIPISAGGPMTLSNARVLCRTCNSRKGAHERVSHR